MRSATADMRSLSTQRRHELSRIITHMKANRNSRVTFELNTSAQTEIQYCQEAVKGQIPQPWTIYNNLQERTPHSGPK